MPQQVYEIQGPDGKTYEIQSDHVPTRIEVSRALSRASGYQPDPTMQDFTRRAIANTQAIGLPRIQQATDELGRSVDRSGQPIHEPDTYWGGFVKSLKDQLLG